MGKENETLVDGKCKANSLAQTCPEGEVKKNGKCGPAFGDCKEGETLGKDGKCAPAAFAHGCPDGQVAKDGKCVDKPAFAHGCKEGETLGKDGKCTVASF